MTEQLHPMVPPSILLNNWESDWFDERQNVDVLLIQAYQSGADAELEACCKWLESEPDPGHVDLLRSCATALRDARRPKPQSLNSVALEMLSTIEKMDVVIPEITDTIRRALEALPDD